MAQRAYVRLPGRLGTRSGLRLAWEPDGERTPLPWIMAQRAHVRLPDRPGTRSGLRLAWEPDGERTPLPWIRSIGADKRAGITIRLDRQLEKENASHEQ